MRSAPAETITCAGCGNPTPKRTYATKRCPTCEEEFHQRRVGNLIKPPAPAPVAAPPAAPDQPIGKVVAAEAKAPYDSKTESRYAEHLETLRLAGEIKHWRHHPWKFRLADKTYYSFDFAVYLLDGTIEIVEVKGSWKAAHQEDARVKLKVAAEQFSEFRFVAVVPDGGGWERETF